MLVSTLLRIHLALCVFMVAADLMWARLVGYSDIHFILALLTMAFMFWAYILMLFSLPDGLIVISFA